MKRSILSSARLSTGSTRRTKSNAEKVGFIKTLVQHELAIAQEQNNGKPLSLEERRRRDLETLKANIDPRKEKWLGMAFPSGRRENTTSSARRPA
jgi:hypothetical protein